MNQACRIAEEAVTHLARIAGRLTVMLACALQIAATGAAGTVLHEQSSPFGPIVVTDEGDGLRALRFGRDGVRQSLVKPGDPEHLGLAYTPVALAGLALCNEPRRMLVIGLGGGTLPAFLRRHYPAAEIDAVDINPEVVAVAKDWFGFSEDARMRIHVADGRNFIEAVRQPYDAIFLDAFGAEAVPMHLTTREFLGAVRRALRPDGVVIGNIWSIATKPPYAAMVRTYRETFDTLHVLRVAGTNNRILYALPRQQPLQRRELAAMARQLSDMKKFRFSAGTLVERGLLPADTEAFGGSVLTDAGIGR